MWLMMLLNKNIDQMQALGLQLTAEDIYNVNHSSIKDGVVQYGGGCTGEIISSQGLLLTNHHCGFGAVQSLSTEKNNYLRDGFWAKTLKDELPCEGLTVKFFIKMEDVSTTVLAQLNDNMTEPQRNEAIEKVSQEIMTAYSEQGKYLVKVSNMFNANAFYVFVYQEYKDVRLVGVVPESLGKYGGDTDNWMWPRHTADFSLFRVYTAPDGQPATYSEKNIPLKPKFHFPVSTSGVKEDDFAMIIGFPGRTDRYLSSYGVKMAMQEKNPTIVKVRDVKLDIMKNFSQKDPKIELQYAAKMSGISNYWKYYIGQTEQLEKNKVYDKKVAIEDAFRAWIKNNNKQSEYGQVLSD